jgi:hypothetical protein
VNETLIVDRPQAGTVVLQLNRPKQLNAMSSSLLGRAVRRRAADIRICSATASFNVTSLAGD